MITATDTDRLLVISDIHLGNRLFHVRSQVLEFLKYAYDNDYNLCINGDGVDIVHSTLFQMTRDLSAFNSYLRRMSSKGLHVYYIVGNHDIVLEHFLDDWEIIQVTPFLNVTSGEKRIHVEHGHLHDEAFLQYPRFYLFVTWVGRWALKIHPRVYHAFESIKPAGEWIGRMLGGGHREPVDENEGESIPNESPAFRRRANEIIQHGFDYVIFGHTHCAGVVELPDGGCYMNTGSWLQDPYFVGIECGRVRMQSVASVLGTKAEPNGTRNVPASHPADGSVPAPHRIPRQSHLPNRQSVVHSPD